MLTPHPRGVMRCITVALIIVAAQIPLTAANAVADWTLPLREEVAVLGKPAWRPLLRYTADLHQRATKPAQPPFEFPWEEIGPGYGYGPAFGHWDIVHEILDVLPTAPEHARQQILNNVRLQLPDGFLPGVVWMPGSPGAPEEDGAIRKKYSFNTVTQSHPPVWPVAADEYMELTDNRAHLREFYDRICKQIDWFEKNRSAEGAGYFYNDIRLHKWESGVDEGVRFDGTDMGAKACIDATAHVYLLCDYAARWARQLGEDETPWRKRADALRTFINTRLWSEDDGFYFDSWAIDDPKFRHQAYEGLWPLITGAATQAQADRVIREWVMNPKRFFTKHPIATVGATDPKFELRMWRGPAWNSMTYWVARACVRYGHAKEARQILEAALDDTAAQFDRTGELWEFFHSHGGKPEEVQRKPHTKRNQPWTDYLGHNPVFAMARLWNQLTPSPAEKADHR